MASHLQYMSMPLHERQFQKANNNGGDDLNFVIPHLFISHKQSKTNWTVINEFHVPGLHSVEHSLGAPDNVEPGIERESCPMYASALVTPSLILGGVSLVDDDSVLHGRPASAEPRIMALRRNTCQS